MKIEYAFSISKADAHERLRALGDYLQNKHKIAVAWDGDRATFKGRFLVVKVEGTLALSDTKVVFDGKDPGILWRAKATNYITGKLKKYLDPACPLTDLPRH